MRLLYPIWNSGEHRLRAGWRLLVHLVVTIAALIASVGLILFAGALGADESSQNIVGAFAQALAIVSAGLFCFVFIDRRKISELKIDRGFFREFLQGCLLGAALMSSIFVICLVCGWVTIERIGAASAQQWMTLIAWQLLWLTIMTMVGISEEFFSRGQQLKNLAEGLRWAGIPTSVALAILISSAVFGLLHLGNPNSTIFSTISIMGAGIFLSLARIFSGRLALPIGVHTTWNYFQGWVFGFAVSGQQTNNSLMQVTSTGPSWLTGGEFGPEAGVTGIAAMLVGIVLLFAWRKRWAMTRQYPIEVDVFQLTAYKKLRRKRKADVLVAQGDAEDAQALITESNLPKLNHDSWHTQ